MLKEGWDCKSVYVIASLRSSVSEVLTEQTLGRGLRLPFGEYTNEPLLDELDVVAHERYEQLLARSNALTQSFIDHRTVVHRPTGSSSTPGGGGVAETTATDPSGSVERHSVASVVGPLVSGTSGELRATAENYGGRNSGFIGITTAEDRLKAVDESAEAAQIILFPRRTLDEIVVPVMVTTAQTQAFSTNMLTDESVFREIGFKLAKAPDPFLRRTQIGAEVQASLLDGSRVVKLSTRPSQAQVKATTGAGDIEEAKAAIVAEIVNGPLVAARAGERASVKRLLDAVLLGAGSQAEMLLQSYARAVSRALRDAIASERAKLTLTQLVHSTETQAFLPGTRRSRAEKSADRHGQFVKGVAYTGYAKSLYEQDWFDSRPERDLANIADTAGDVEFWVRLQRDDLPILWNGASQSYNPDFLVRGSDGATSVVEVKADNALPTPEVQGKRQAALAWANAASASAGKWAYLLAAERDLAACQGDWGRLVQLTRP